MYSQDEQIDFGLDIITDNFHGIGNVCYPEGQAGWPPRVRRLMRRIFRKMNKPIDVKLFKLSHDRFVLRWRDGRIGLDEPRLWSELSDFSILQREFSLTRQQAFDLISFCYLPREFLSDAGLIQEIKD
jgi:hypothetical protein